jgi:hypothetical protein
MFIEAVIVCVDYADFLAYTLPQAKLHLDHIVVVTTPSDKETQQLCKHHNVECIRTNSFYEGGDKFNKAKGINEGLNYLSKRDWVIHMDADIYLPPMTRDILHKKKLDTAKIYGIDRLMCPDYDSWVKYVKKPRLIHDSWMFIHLDAFPIASRVADYNGDGYSPIGYFQLWHPNNSGVKTYPETHGAADRTDMLFAKKWTKDKRELLPEFVAIHLDSEDATVKEMGKNWSGRKTQPFAYQPVKKKRSWLKTSLLVLLGLAIGSVATWVASNANDLMSLFQF